MPFDLFELFFGGPWRDRLAGGRADRRTPADFDPRALAKGRKVEREHTSDPRLATEIAMDHLVEDPRYYDALEKMEHDLSRTRKRRGRRK